jgi:propionyl-CoA synthetase
VQRDTGGYAVALTASMRDIFCVAPGETMFTTSDIGWVVGTFLYRLRAAAQRVDDDPVRGLADPARSGVWWQIVAEHKVARCSARRRRYGC